jgi:hypothetical protein
VSTQVEAGAESGLAFYVYGVVDADAAPPGAAVEVTTLPVGPVAALVGPVPLAEVGEDAVRARLEDPAWLAAAAQTHEAVLGAALASGPVVPFRLLTVFRDGGELRDYLAARGDDLRAVLDRVRGKVEVGVKAFVDRAVLDEAVSAGDPALAGLDAEIASAQAGRAYLLRRRREQAVRDASSRRATELAGEAHTRLRTVAEDGVANPVQSHEASGRDDDMILNGAYLVAAGDTALADELDALRSRYAALGVSFERTGPWPPYNFVPRDLGST